MAELKLSGNKFFQKAKIRAASVVKDNRKLNQVISSTKDKLEEINLEDTKVYKLGDRLRVITRMIRSYVTGQYKELPWKTMITFVAGLIYFLMPLDLLPDFIPVTGFIDDFTVIMLISSAFKHDIDDFLLWEQTEP
jgi:uncharacterized membrane protein YkvA (DUF1232 family)